jgi:hypothetical protein
MGKHSRSRKTRSDHRGKGSAARPRRRSAADQRSTPGSGPRSKPLTALNLDGLPPTPTQMPGLRNLAQAASDGTVSVPVMSAGNAGGWSVFDAQGRMVELLVFHHTDRPVKAEYRILDGFECSRDLVGDPLFAGYDIRRREQCAAEAPDGEPDYVSYHYRYEREPERDGTCGVLVSAYGAAVAWLVLDADGNLVDGTPVLRCADAGTPVEDRCRAFLQRRLLTDEPRMSSSMLDLLGPDCGCGSESGSEHS